MTRFSDLGCGVGLRVPHFDYILANWPAIDWFEILSENFLDTYGRPRYVLDRIREHYPIVMHGVSLNLGSSDPLDFEYLGKLKRLAKEIGAAWLSDHLCWTGVAGRNTHDLLPLPLCDETLDHVAARLRTVQDFLEQPILIENPSTYCLFQSSTMPEWEFLNRLCTATSCALLLDVNNVYVSAHNLGYSAAAYLDAIPAAHIGQIHLAGHKEDGNHLIDSHDRAVTASVWALYQQLRKRISCSTLLEWDDEIPEFPLVHAEVLKARTSLVSAEAPLP